MASSQPAVGDRCQLCEVEFSFTTRKHNCRVCGGVFCAQCSSDKVNIGNAGLQRACFLCYSAQEHLDSDEQKIVDDLCNELGEYPVMRTMVLRKRTQSAKRQHVMLVVSRHRLIRIPRSAPKSFVSWSLLDLASITVPKGNTIVLELGKQTGEQILEQFETAKAAEVVLTIRSQHQLLCNGMPPEFQLRVDLPPETTLPLPQLPPVGAAGGFIEAYRAWSNFYHTAPSEELMQFIQDSEHRQPHILNLSVCPGIEAGTNVTFDLQPVFAALRHNSYYLSVELCDSVQQGVVMQHLADFLKFNKSVTRLVLRNLTTSYMSSIGNALAENRANVIQELDFSGTQLSEKAVRSLALALVVKEFGIRALKLANCGLTPKSAAILFREGLLPSPEISLVLETLDLSENKLELEGSSMVQIWLSKLGKRGQLRSLSISRSAANLMQVVKALEAGAPFLEALDVSNNVTDPETCRTLANYLATCTCLKKFDMSGCGITPFSQNQILNALFSNANLPQLELANANNVMDEQSILQLTAPFEKIANGLHTLDLSLLKLTESSCITLFQCLANVRNLDTLTLNDCFSSISGHLSGMLVGHALADMLVQSPGIKKLVLSAKKSLGMFTGPPSHVILPFIQRMQRNESLLQLDVSGNRIGDQIAIALAELLRCNTTLLELNLDRNNVTLTGYQALEYGMHRNQTLQRFEYPVSDVYKGLRNLSSSKVKQRALLQILTNIQLAVHFNQHNNGLHPRVAEEPAPAPHSGPLLRYDDQQQPDLAAAAPPQQQFFSQVPQPVKPDSYAAPPLPARNEPMDPWGYNHQGQAAPLQPEPLAPVPVSAPINDWGQPQQSNDWGQPQPAQDWAQPAQDWSQHQNQSYSDGWGQQQQQQQPQPEQWSGGAGGDDWSSKFGGGGGGGGEEVDRTSDLYLALASVLGGQQQ